MNKNFSSLSRLIACLAILTLISSCNLSSNSSSKDDESSSNEYKETSKRSRKSRKSENTVPKKDEQEDEVVYSGFTNTSVEEAPSDNDNQDNILILTNSSEDE